jgi:hypothetical protein
MKWTSASLDPLKLLLDVENPRIDLSETANQNQIRVRLLQTEDVVGLAKKIIAAGGLLAGERIIVTRENSRDIVLEGNRRTCACQLLLDPKLIPSEFRGRFPRSSDPELQSSISTIEADVAPDRDAAEYTITQRHTQPGILEWRPAAQHRRVQRLVTHGRSIDQIAEDFGVRRSDILRILRQGALINAVHDLKIWSDKEREALRSPGVKTNPYTRFFTLKGVREALGVSFDEEDGSVHARLDATLFSSLIEQLARGFLLPDSVTGKTRFNTRTAPQEVYRFIQERDPKFEPVFRSELQEDTAGHRRPHDSGQGPRKWGTSNSDGDANAPANPSSANDVKPVARRKLRAKTFDFFEGLQCPINDRYLLGFADEISRIDYKKFPVAASFLARGLVEQTLLWSIKKVNLYGGLMQSIGGQREPKLSELINFCITNQAEIFKRNPTRVLNQWRNTHKDYCDLLVHGRWLVAKKEVLEHLASETRGFIEDILSGDLVK